MQNKRERIMLVTGCSHAAGHEIDGEQDSAYNRANSFGSKLANSLGYTPVNMALGGQSNPSITRGILEWFHKVYDPELHDVFVLVSWTESSRMDVPGPFSISHLSGNPHAQWYARVNSSFVQINSGWKGGNLREQEFVAPYHEFQAMNLKYLQIISANCALQLQYFFQSRNIRYVMCNTMQMFDPDAYVGTYLKHIDQTHYIDMLDNSKAFYWYYRNLGFNNPKAKYWHHDEVPHDLYAQKLLAFIETHNI